MYWGRKPFMGLSSAFVNVKKGDIVLDPLCGSGSPAVAALMKGARVIAADLNPMAVFMTRVLVRPISIPALEAAFEDVKERVAHAILGEYEVKCPRCRKTAQIEYVLWEGKADDAKPIKARVECDNCRYSDLKTLTPTVAKRQVLAAKMRPRRWYPKSRIHSSRKPPVIHHYELFTGRNLSMLAELLHAINQTSTDNCRDALLYVFTALLYSCSNMQMFSEKEPSSSRGWTAKRYYVPPKRKEKNVWKTFETRFKSLLNCKKLLNREIPWVRVTDSPKEFFSKGYEALAYRADSSDAIRSHGKHVQHVFLDPPYNDDIDYLGFSEFWGSWLRMKFDFRAEWHPRELKAEGLEKLLPLHVPGKICSGVIETSVESKEEKELRSYLRVIAH
ncbi:hypothetical protein ACFL1X_14050 [Candidatus Hydrogenedentota bacterium]